MFSPRKKGFAKEVSITEFKEEYNEDKMNEEFSEEVGEEKIDLVDYLNELDIEDLDESELEELEKFVIEKSDEELLADFIRERSMGALLTSKAFLKEEDENIEEILQKLNEDENCKDITKIEGSNDIYYYSNKFMSENYAMIAMLVADKDLARTIAEMVRWNAKTYPCATPIYYFKNSPYYYKNEEIEVSISNIKGDEKYSDIGELTTGNNVRYLYSTLHISEKYARALAESAEIGEGGYY
jgi:hypothetical protein